MKISKAHYQSVCRDYWENWAALDQALYDLCKRHPRHHNRDAINTKLWILGRTYATGIERQIRSNGTQGNSLERLAEKFYSHRHDVDKILSQLQKVKQPLNPEKLTKILEAHGQFLRLIKKMKLIRGGQSPRSFVSKYLHFHHPVVPIYDSVALKVLKGKYSRMEVNGEVQLPKGADDDYWNFLRRFWKFYQEIKKSGGEQGVKLADNYLLALAKEEE
jgi:hypothetical protein